MFKRKKDVYNIQKVLSVFHSTPNEHLGISDFEDVLQGIIHSLKKQPDVFTAELFRFFYKYMSYKNDYSLVEILNLINTDN